MLRKYAEDKNGQKERKLTFAESARLFGKALKVSIAARGSLSIVISLIGFAMAFLPMLIALAVRRFSDEVQAIFGKGTAFIASAAGVFIILSVLYIVQLLWNSLKSYFEARDAYKIQMFMRERILRCSCDVKYKYIDNYDKFRERISFVTTTAGERVANSVGMTITWFQDIITFISIIVVLWAVDFWIVLILVAACIPAIVLAYFFSEEEYSSKGLWILEWLMTCAYFFEAVMPESLNDVRFFNAYPWLKKKFNAMNKKYITIKNRVTRKHVLYNSIADIFRSCVYVFILLITVRRIFDNPAVGIGAFMLVFMMAGQLQEVTARIFGTAAMFVSNAAYIRDFFSLDELDYEKRDKNAVPMEKYDVEFDRVSFSYPNTEREVLHHLSGPIRDGEKVAIVGENGSGTTTFVNLLCALYEPDNGSIRIGGRDICENLSRTRRTISAVFQEFPHYETTIRENIVVSDSRREVSDEQLAALAEKTGAGRLLKSSRTAWTKSSELSAPAGTTSAAASGRKLRFCAVLIETTRRLWCWTNRQPRSTRWPRPNFTAVLPISLAAGRRY
jgi:ABC-type multidrug transport system fused ATPase/permease subunit